MKKEDFLKSSLWTRAFYNEEIDFLPSMHSRDAIGVESPFMSITKIR
jgi:hypothetical protein